MKFKQIKLFALCALLTANTGLQAMTFKNLLVGIGVLSAANYYLATETALSDWSSSRVHVKDDAEFMVVSNRELEDIDYDFGYLTTRLFDDLDSAIKERVEAGSLHNDSLRLLGVRRGRLANLLKYQPLHATQEIFNQREKLLQAQANLDFLANWVTKSRIFCMQEAMWIRRSYHAEIDLLGVGDRAGLRRAVYDSVLNQRRSCYSQKNYNLSDYKNDLQSARDRLQKAIKLFLKAADWHVVPASVQKLLFDLDKLQEIVIVDSIFVNSVSTLVPNWTTHERLLLDQQVGKIWQEYAQELTACKAYRIENALYHDRKIAKAIESHMIRLHKEGLISNKYDFVGYENLLLQDRANLQAALDRFLTANPGCTVPWSIDKLLNNSQWDKEGLYKIQEVLLWHAKNLTQK